MKNFGDNLTQRGIFHVLKADYNIQEQIQFEPKPITSNKWYVTMPSPLQEEIFDSYHYF